MLICDADTAKRKAHAEEIRQLYSEGEQTRRTPHHDENKRRPRKAKILRYHRGGWLKFTVINNNDLLMRIRITHAEAHPPFPDSLGRRKVLKDKDDCGDAHDRGGPAANSTFREDESAGGGLMQDGYFMGGSEEVERYEEPRVRRGLLYHIHDELTLSIRSVTLKRLRNNLIAPNG